MIRPPHQFTSQDGLQKAGPIGLYRCTTTCCVVAWFLRKAFEFW